MKKIFLLLAIALLPSFRGFSQNSTAIVDSGDSLVCFPQRYLQFMVEDIKQGKKDKVKVQELENTNGQIQSELVSVKSILRDKSEDNSSLRDSLEMKNALIGTLHVKERTVRTKKTVCQCVAILSLVL